MNILDSGVCFDALTGALEGRDTSRSVRTLSDLKGIFADQAAFDAMDPDQIVYEVTTHQPVPEGTMGGLLFGVSSIHPGAVGGEYFMTKGHFHANRDTAEYYFGIGGTGILLFMDGDGVCRAEQVKKGSLHYIPGNVAHRLINTGEDVLVVGASWLSDAGHDYEAIRRKGFSVRVKRVNGVPSVVCE